MEGRLLMKEDVIRSLEVELEGTLKTATHALNNDANLGAKALDTVSRELTHFADNLAREIATWEYLSDPKEQGLLVLNK
eukprot:614969-Pyramimonas_sp.AAC.1